jgi:hypothetical protein
VSAPARGDIVVDGVYRALPDAAVDRVFSVLTALVAEVWTVRDRLRLAEVALAEHGIDVEAVFTARRDTDEEQALMRVDRDAFVERVFRAVTPPHQSAASTAARSSTAPRP